MPLPSIPTQNANNGLKNQSLHSRNKNDIKKINSG